MISLVFRACTLEAVAAALRILEGSASVAVALRDNMLLKVNALLRMKGKIKQNDFKTVQLHSEDM
jgi:hypothetical protein